MIKLEIEFNGKGEVSEAKFKQLNASEKAFMYELTDIETGLKRYEVFERRVQKEQSRVINGAKREFVEKELYPKSNAFGVWAWCFNDYNKALLTWQQLNTG